MRVSAAIVHTLRRNAQLRGVQITRLPQEPSTKNKLGTQAKPKEIYRYIGAPQAIFFLHNLRSLSHTLRHLRFDTLNPKPWNPEP